MGDAAAVVLHDGFDFEVVLDTIGQVSFLAFDWKQTISLAFLYSLVGGRRKSFCGFGLFLVSMVLLLLPTLLWVTFQSKLLTSAAL